MAWKQKLAALALLGVAGCSEGGDEAVAVRSDTRALGTAAVALTAYAPPPVGQLSYSPASLRPAWGGVAFTACPTEALCGLWTSDGTAAGTRRVMPAGRTTGLKRLPYGLRTVGTRALFVSDDGTSPCEQPLSASYCQLWGSDGTEAGTQRLSTFNARGVRPIVSATRVIGDHYLFQANDGEGRSGLWSSDGSAEGTRRLWSGAEEFGPGRIGEASGRILFAGEDAEHGLELWVSDGSVEGTTLLKDLVPGTGSSGPGFVAEARGLQFFIASDAAHGVELWRTDGTPEGTALVADVRPGADSALDWFAPNVQAVAFRDALVFVADDGVHGPELWRTDGTPGGTMLVKELRTGAQGADITYLSAAGDTLYFFADDGTSGPALWRSDATPEGTQPVRPLRKAGPQPGIGRIVSPPLALEQEGVLLFTAEDPALGVELWRSNGTAAGTLPVQDLVTGAASSWPDELVRVGDRVFFAALDGTQARQLWTLPVTVLADFTPPQLRCPADLTVERAPATGATVSYAPAESADAVSLVYSQRSGTSFPVGSTPVEVSASDAAGNSARCSFTVTVRAREDERPHEGCEATSGGTSLLVALLGLLRRRRHAA